MGTLKGGEHRTPILAQFVVDELAKTVRGKTLNAVIWPSQTGGYLKPPATHDSWLSGAVARCQAAAELARAAEGEEPSTPVFPRITAHDLGHTAASLAIASGANVKVVQRMLGHKSAAMTLDVYADLFDDDLTAVADRIEESVGKLWARPGLAAVESL
ncbi:tyrosine-type recombinase/integrase [Mycolicibacterium fluoranthenivorans]|uniref:tyrosine-type recombinase/integrase n=1 Tax=Mycolicibacterium fluoranthenivorans TaxID=258505 RepID=UPI001F33D0E2|nr:tyrosine-type recombinase/integrase [Mycolicibacterium fluoranthenivorans]